MGDTTRREAIEAAFDSLSEAEDVPDSQPVETPPPASAADEAGPAESAAAPTPAVDRSRDDQGRFAKEEKERKEKAEKAAKAMPVVKAVLKPTAPTAKLGAAPAAVPPVVVKPPQSWKPNAREEWTKVPEGARQEILRRESEITKALQEAAQRGKAFEPWQGVIAPHENRIRAEGQDPRHRVSGLLQMDHLLRTGPEPAKAQLFAGLIKQSGVSLQALAAALDGAPIPQGAAPQQDVNRIVEERLGRFVQQAQEQRMRETLEQKIQERDQFAAKQEFFEDVREDMADILEVAARRGVAMSMEDAYSRAIQLNPEIRDVLKQREDAKRATTTPVATKRARAAAASTVRSEPAPGVSAGADKPQSRREAIEAAWEKHESR